MPENFIKKAARIETAAFTIKGLKSSYNFRKSDNGFKEGNCFK